MWLLLEPCSEAWWDGLEWGGRLSEWEGGCWDRCGKGLNIGGGDLGARGGWGESGRQDRISLRGSWTKTVDSTSAFLLVKGGQQAFCQVGDEWGLKIPGSGQLGMCTQGTHTLLGTQEEEPGKPPLSVCFSFLQGSLYTWVTVLTPLRAKQAGGTPSLKCGVLSHYSVCPSSDFHPRIRVTWKRWV